LRFNIGIVWRESALTAKTYFLILGVDSLCISLHHSLVFLRIDAWFGQAMIETGGLSLRTGLGRGSVFVEQLGDPLFVFH
jgi:hypothetical protein